MRRNIITSTAVIIRRAVQKPNVTKERNEMRVIWMEGSAFHRKIRTAFSRYSGNDRESGRQDAQLTREVTAVLKFNYDVRYTRNFYL